MEWSRKLLRLEPGVSLGWWIYERSVAAFPVIASLSGGSMMGYWAAISDRLDAWGPIGWGAAGLASALLIWIVLALARLMGAVATERRSKAEAIREWGRKTDAVNPLDNEFHKQRIKIADLANPVSKRIEKKRFVDCELYGPATVVLAGPGTSTHVGWINCDIVVMKDWARVSNANYNGRC